MPAGIPALDRYSYCAVILNAWTPKARCADLLNDMLTRQGDLWPHAAITSDLSHNRTSLRRSCGVALPPREQESLDPPANSVR